MGIRTACAQAKDTLPFMPMVTKDMTEEEVSRSRDLMIQHVKELCPTLPGKLPGLAIVGE